MHISKLGSPNFRREGETKFAVTALYGRSLMRYSSMLTLKNLKGKIFEPFVLVQANFTASDFRTKIGRKFIGASAIRKWVIEGGAK